MYLREKSLDIKNPYSYIIAFFDLYYKSLFAKKRTNIVISYIVVQVDGCVVKSAQI